MRGRSSVRRFGFETPSPESDKEGTLTGGISSRPEGSPPDYLTPPFRGTAYIGRSLDLDLLQCFEHDHKINIYGWIKIGYPTDFEGGLDGIRAELAEVRLEYVGILEKYRSPWLYQSVQSVEEDEPYRHQRPGVMRTVTKGVIINSGHPPVVIRTTGRLILVITSVTKWEAEPKMPRAWKGTPLMMIHTGLTHILSPTSSALTTAPRHAMNNPKFHPDIYIRPPRPLPFPSAPHPRLIHSSSYSSIS